MAADGGPKNRSDDLMAKIMREGAWYPESYKMLTQNPEGSGMMTSSSDGNADGPQSEVCGDTEEAWTGAIFSMHYLAEGCGGKCPCCLGQTEEFEKRVLYWFGGAEE